MVDSPASESGAGDYGRWSMRLSEILDRILLGGYEAAKEDATRRIVARYTRGNVNVQNGRLISEDGLEKLLLAGDKAMKKLRVWATTKKR